MVRDLGRQPGPDVVRPPEGEQRLVPTADIRPSRLNPRKEFREDELAELTESIRSKGLVQPIIVRPAENGYEIVAGERRWRAAQKAGLHTVPVIARDLTDKEVLELAIIANGSELRGSIQRDPAHEL